MRIYTNLHEAIRETERELWEMSIDVHPETMQDKDIRDDPDYLTKEVRGYAFKIVDWFWDIAMVKRVMEYFFKEESDSVLTYVLAEFRERVSGKVYNPGKSYLQREELWQEFLHNGKFAYTYSERMAPQLMTILTELRNNPETRQAIINIHSNICPQIDRQLKDTGQDENFVGQSADLDNRGGGDRVPCSMYYQIMIREKRVDFIYTMRSCDFLTHFPVDISLALLLQDWFADSLNLKTGTFTYFVGSLHAYQKDLKDKGIF